MTPVRLLQSPDMGGQLLASDSVIAGMSYLAPDAVDPISYAFEPPPGTPWESCTSVIHQVPITDARAADTAPNIHREGFELWDAPSAVTDFLDDEAVRNVYYAESAELALAVTGASRAYVFDHLVRRREPDRAALTFGRSLRGVPPAANGRSHNDYTEASGVRRLAAVVPEAERPGPGARFCIVNVWRSIRGPVLDTPLAVCDAQTVLSQDLVVGQVRYRQRTGEIYQLRFSPRHRWAYFPRMDRHEALVFKQYDSQVSGVARFTPHAAFDHPQVPDGAPLRESIELRCLLTYD